MPNASANPATVSSDRAASIRTETKPARNAGFRQFLRGHSLIHNAQAVYDKHGRDQDASENYTVSRISIHPSS
jgi:hypothetical protein